MTKTVLIVLAVLFGSCLLCGGALAVLGLVADVRPDATKPGAPAQLAGENPAELVGLWDTGPVQLELASDGRARQWVRHHWDGRDSTLGALCKLEADLEGTWTAGGNRLTLDLTDGRWVDCNGPRPFTPTTDTFTYRFSADHQVVWLKGASGEQAYGLQCPTAANCVRVPKPLP